MVHCLSRNSLRNETPSDGTDLSYYASFRSTAGISKLSKERSGLNCFRFACKGGCRHVDFFFTPCGNLLRKENFPDGSQESLHLWYRTEGPSNPVRLVVDDEVHRDGVTVPTFSLWMSFWKP